MADPQATTALRSSDERALAQHRFAQFCSRTLRLAQAAYSKGGDQAIKGLLLYDAHADNIAACQQWAAQNWSDPQWRDCALEFALAAGEVLSLRLEPERCIRQLEVGLLVARANSDRESEAKALGNTGIMCGLLGDWRRAAEYHELALVISRELKSRRSQCEDLTNLGLAMDGLREHGAARTHYDEALLIAKELRDLRVQAKILGNLAGACFSLSEIDNAEAYLFQQLQICKELDDFAGEASARTNLGAICRANGQHEKAIPHYERALGIDIALHDQRGEAHTRLGLGNTLLETGKTFEALAQYKLALGAFRGVGYRPGEAFAIYNIGVTLSEYRNDKRGAIPYFTETCRLAHELGDQKQECDALIKLARDSAIVADWDSVVKHNQHLLEFGETVVSNAARMQAMSALGNAFAKRERYGEALASFQDAERYARDIGDAKGVTRALRNQGLAEMRLQAPDSASRTFESYLEAARALASVHEEARACYSLAKALKACGKDAKALAIMQDAEKLFSQGYTDDAAKAALLVRQWAEDRASSGDISGAARQEMASVPKCDS